MIGAVKLHTATSRMAVQEFMDLAEKIGVSRDMFNEELSKREQARKVERGPLPEPKQKAGVPFSTEASFTPDFYTKEQMDAYWDAALDSVLTDALAFGDALNHACWAFGDHCPEKSALLFSNTKQSLRAAIIEYMRRINPK